MTEAEAAAFLARTSEMAAELEALNTKLRDFHDSVPVSPLEALIFAGEEDMDFATTLRSTSECLLVDRLEPALAELKTMAVYKPPTEEKK
jgi:hypothetical protein